METPPKITVAHVQAVHDAAHDTEEEAGPRDERMPSSAKAIRDRAVQLREVEGFLLQFIPEQQRGSYLPSDTSPRYSLPKTVLSVVLTPCGDSTSY